ncbi:MAG: hypothetical protein GKR90_22460 [Pseudomonadales bacterium]|nr:hypothetical protein [Pseudomonadales bacterium]
MKRVSLKDTVEVIGVLSIVATLIFVVFEIRQNTNAVRSSVTQSVSEQSIEILQMLIENAELRQARIAVNTDSVTDDQRSQVDYLYALLIRNQQNRYLQFNLGVVDAETMVLLGGNAPVYRTPDFRRYWDSVKERQPPEFRRFMEETNIGLTADNSLPPM